MSRERGQGGARRLSAGGGDGPRLRPRAHDRARRARPRLCRARAVRKRGGDGPGGAQGERDRHGRESTGSSANIGCAIASGSSGRARPATSMPGSERSFSADRALPDETAKPRSARAGRRRDRSSSARDDRHRRRPCARHRRFSRGCALPRRTAARSSAGAPAWPWDRRCEAAAGCRGATVRSARISTGASSQTVIARSLSSLRVRGSTKAPPPVAITRTSPSIRRATRRRSPSRKSLSP